MTGLVRSSSTEAFVAAPDGAEICELVRPDTSPLRRLSIAEVHVAPRVAAAPHRHLRTEESYVVLSGTGRVRVDDQELAVEAGDVICIPVGAVHRISNASPEPLRYLAISSPPYSAEDLHFVDDGG
jgi:mannose-6-phosphate isomerase-like protein (cupin superfamily)